MYKTIIIKTIIKKFGQSCLVKCNICGKERYLNKFQVDAGRGKFCGRKCSNKASLGRVPWNYGVIGAQTAWNKGMIGYHAGENHPRYSAIPSYHAAHYWLRRYFGNPKKCSFCGVSSHKKKKWNVQYALIKGKEHARNIDNYLPLCVRCHKKYDKKIKFSI